MTIAQADDPHSIFTQELQNLPSTLKAFVVREGQREAYEGTWEGFARGYGGAFDMLVDRVLDGSPNRQLAAPIFFLCRHSVELSIKAAIVEFASSRGGSARIEGHSLLRLWNELLRENVDAGFGNGDEWTTHCGKLIGHMHAVDPDGERFRYPTSRAGIPFGFTRIEIRELAVAHWHIALICDGMTDMLSALGRQGR